MEKLQLCSFCYLFIFWGMVSIVFLSISCAGWSSYLFKVLQFFVPWFLEQSLQLCMSSSYVHVQHVFKFVKTLSVSTASGLTVSWRSQLTSCGYEAEDQEHSSRLIIDPLLWMRSEVLCAEVSIFSVMWWCLSLPFRTLNIDLQPLSPCPNVFILA